MDFPPPGVRIPPHALDRAVDLLVSQPPPPGRERPFRVTAADRREVGFAVQHLDAFGYLSRQIVSASDVELPPLLAAIRLFQRRCGLERHGRLCAKTIHAMEAPRCGCPDLQRKHRPASLAVSRWAYTRLPAWRRRALTYCVADYVPGPPKCDQDRIFAAAVDAWTRLGNVGAERTDDESSADIVISTGEGPRSNFDGPGGTLAWATVPDGADCGLRICFDLTETWTIGANARGVALLNVATHELGHAFGLEHSDVPSALMAPWYNAAVATPQAYDDTSRFQARYGARAWDAMPPSGARVMIEGAADVWVGGERVAGSGLPRPGGPG